MSSTASEVQLETLSHELQQSRAALLTHPLYSAVQSTDSLRIFMREHVFAVWDFMSLLKRLQRVVTCCDVPWMPVADASVARFINEIVLGEESDEDGRGGYTSHFELYLEAMDEIGADTQPIRQFVSRLRDGEHPDLALDQIDILPNTREFVRSTMRLANERESHQVAAAFFHGREDVIPEMFKRFVESLQKEGHSIDRFRHYLNRHIELDANDHGPLAQKLVDRLCDGRIQFQIETAIAANAAIAQRIALWDGILFAISHASH